MGLQYRQRGSTESGILGCPHGTDRHAEVLDLPYSTYRQEASQLSILGCPHKTGKTQAVLGWAYNADKQEAHSGILCSSHDTDRKGSTQSIYAVLGSVNNLDGQVPHKQK